MDDAGIYVEAIPFVIELRAEVESLRRQIAEMERSNWRKGQAMQRAAHRTELAEADLAAVRTDLSVARRAADGLAVHLRALCEHPDNYEHRYEVAAGRPCSGCYDALIDYDAGAVGPSGQRGGLAKP